MFQYTILLPDVEYGIAQALCQVRNLQIELFLQLCRSSLRHLCMKTLHSVSKYM